MRALILATVLFAAASANAATLTVGTTGTVYPMTFTRDDVLQGFDIDVINAIADVTGDDVEFVTMTLSSLIGALDAKKVQTIANQITITPARAERYLFSDPYVIDGAQVVVRAGNEDEIDGVEALSGRSVGVILGSNFEALLRELDYADEIDIRTYDANILEQETVMGRIDAYVRDQMSAIQIIDEVKLPLKLAGKPFAPMYNAFPFTDDSEGEALRVKFDDALKVLHENGTLTELSEKWFGRDVTSENP